MSAYSFVMEHLGVHLADHLHDEGDFGEKGPWILIDCHALIKVGLNPSIGRTFL